MTVMVIPVSQHKLIKIRKANRIKLTKIALYCSTAGLLCNLLGSSTNTWLYTSEVLKYYVFPNISAHQSFDYELPMNQPVYFKNATMGPWKFCWLDPITDFHCHPVQYLVDDDPNDVTTSVQQTVRRAFVFMLAGVVLDILGAVFGFLCSRRPNPYGFLLVSSIVHIFAGIANFMCIIVYMAAVSKEVGNKIYPASEMDDPLFHYSYGFSFIALKCSFLLTQAASLFTVVVFMAKRDERTFHRYKLRSLMNFKKFSEEGEVTDAAPEQQTHQHARFAHRISYDDTMKPEMDDIISNASSLNSRRLSIRRSFKRPSNSKIIAEVPTFFTQTLTPAIGNKGVARFPLYCDSRRRSSSMRSDTVSPQQDTVPHNMTEALPTIMI